MDMNADDLQSLTDTISAILLQGPRRLLALQLPRTTPISPANAEDATFTSFSQGTQKLPLRQLVVPLVMKMYLWRAIDFFMVVLEAG